MRHLLFVVSLAVSAATGRAQAVPPSDSVHRVAKTPMPLFTQRGLWPIGGLHLGTPSLISVAAGGAYGLGSHVPGSVFANVEPGLTSLRFGGGYLLFDDQVSGLGAGVRFARLRAWRQALGAKRGPWYSGIEVMATSFGANARIGSYVARSREREPLMLTTIDLGIGF